MQLHAHYEQPALVGEAAFGMRNSPAYLRRAWMFDRRAPFAEDFGYPGHFSGTQRSPKIITAEDLLNKLL